MDLISQLQELPKRLDMPRPMMREVAAALDSGAMALTLLVFSIPAIVPTPGVPAGMLFGTLLVFAGVQMTIGMHSVRIPGILARLRIDRRTLERLIDRVVPHLEKSRRWLRPRLTGLLTPVTLRGIGLIICLMGALIALPIPFGNVMPGMAVLLLAIGVGQRDGLAVLAGLFMAILSCIASWSLIAGSWWLIQQYA